MDEHYSGQSRSGGRAGLRADVPRIRAIRAGTGKLENWLRRSNESGLRKDTIELARVAKAEVPVDLRVAARSAGGSRASR